MPGCLPLIAAILMQIPRQCEADMSGKSVPHNEETGELETQRPRSCSKIMSAAKGGGANSDIG